MSRHNLDDVIKSPFQYCLGKKHYYLIEEYDVLCDFADTYKETKRVELTEEELKTIEYSLVSTILKANKPNFVKAINKPIIKKIREVLDNGK